jgi:flagellar motor switch protein FliM
MSEPGSAALSPDELDSLLAEVAAPRPSNAPAPAAPHLSGPQPFDFRRPNKFSRDHVRALQIVSETFARQVGTALSTSLRTVSTVTLTSVTQHPYDEFVVGTTNPTMLALLSLDPLPGASIMEFPLHLAMTIVDRMLGGTGVPTGTWPNRPLSEIEAILIRSVIDRGLAELTYAFESLVDLEPSIIQLESNPQFAQVAAPSDMMVLLAFEVKIGVEDGPMHLWIPYSALQPILERATSSTMFVERAAGDPVAVKRAVTSRLEEVPVEVSVCFETVTLRSADIVALRAGDVVPLGHAVDAPLRVFAAGVAVHAARPGKKGKRLAVQIVDSPRSEP